MRTDRRLVDTCRDRSGEWSTCTTAVVHLFRALLCSLLPLFFVLLQFACTGQERKDQLRTQFEAAMREFSPKERQAMFRFATSLDRLPPGGCSSLHPPFTVEIDTRADKTSAHFPEAQTCMNHVLTPSYPDVETMMARLRVAVKDGLEYHYEY